MSPAVWWLFATLFALVLAGGCVSSEHRADNPNIAEEEALAEDEDGAEDEIVAPLTREQEAAVLELARIAKARDGDRGDAVDWYRWRYMGVGIANLHGVSNEQFEGLKQRVREKKGSVYVIVHPAYYLYFQERSTNVPYRTGDPSSNLVERYLANPSGSDPVELLMREQMRIEKEFLRYAAAEGHVVLLVIPGEYRRDPRYRFHEDALDEYARYLNEVSGRSSNFFYVESTSVTRGYVSKGELDDIERFLDRVEARKILLGGGFVGRCQEDFYRNITERVSRRRVAVVAEISSVSHADVDDEVARELLDGRGMLDTSIAVRNIRRNVYNRLEVKPKVVSLLRVEPIIGALVLRQDVASPRVRLTTRSGSSTL